MSDKFKNELTQIKGAVKDILGAIGEDCEREGLVDTPKRVAKSLKFLTKGYDEDPIEVINNAIFEDDYDEMVIVKDIQMYSLCEHHLLPFFGKVHVAYIPKGKIIGLSKIARLVEICARRLQVQEKLTRQIAQILQNALNPDGVAVVIEAGHLCMQMRGVQKMGSSMVTSKMLGSFRNDMATRSEFLSMLNVRI